MDQDSGQTPVAAAVRRGAAGEVGPSELEQLKFAIDQSAIVAVTDVTGRIAYVNDKFCEISKYSREELIGQDHRLINSGHHPKTFIRDLWRTIARGQVWRGEFRNRAKDGSYYWVDTTIVPFVGANGHPRQYMAIRYDITSRKQQEERLRAQSALAVLGQMAAVVAHEVRNPLAGIRSGAQVIGDLVDKDSDPGKIAAEIVRRVDSLNEVVEDILVYSRHREVRRAPLDVSAFVRDLAATVCHDPICAELEVSVETEPEVHAAVDINQMRIVLTNLLTNAAQAMQGRGTLAISVRRQDDSRVVIDVTDTGPGVPAELQERIFEPFVTTKVRGTGLGLPTARRFVEAHGGTLELRTRPEGGALARVTLPVHG